MTLGIMRTITGIPEIGPMSAITTVAAWNTSFNMLNSPTLAKRSCKKGSAGFVDATSSRPSCEDEHV